MLHHATKTCLCNSCRERRRLRALRSAPLGRVDRVTPAVLLRVLGSKFLTDRNLQIDAGACG
jgi:hypothetical protein